MRHESRPGRDQERRVVEMRVSFATLLKVGLAVLVAFAIVELWSLILLFVISLLLAMMFEPVVDFFERKTGRRWPGVLAVALVLATVVVLLAFVIAPATGRQLNALAGNLPQARARVVSAISSSSPALRALVQKLFEMPLLPATTSARQPALMFGKVAVEGMMAFIFALVVTVYFLAEGNKLLAWLVSYVPRNHRSKVRETLPEVNRVALAYMRGQIITCCLCGAWVYTVLIMLHVPAALPLALLAFVADILPVVGTIAMTVPGVLMALTVSPFAAAMALAGYLAYHLVESYFIIPRVYGKAMRLSTLTVLLSVAIGGALQGVAGAVLILPFVAMYPVIERIWLRDWVGDDTVEDHARLERAEEEKREDEEADAIVNEK